MRLVLTRALEDAERTRLSLEAMGHHVLVSPVIEIAGTGASWPAGVVDGIIATSAQAFRVEFGGPLPETRRVVPLFLVGARTEIAARERGFLGAVTTEQNADALLAALDRLACRPLRLVYLAGHDRKPALEEAFAAEGRALEVIEVYEARRVEQLGTEVAKALGQNAVEGVLHFSQRSAALFVAAAQKAGLDISRPAHFCLSEDVAGPIRDAGCAKISVAASPREPDLLALVGPV